MEFTVKLKDAQSKVIIKKRSHLHLNDYFDTSIKTLVISDQQIPSSLKEKILCQLSNAQLIEVEEGEVSKSFETYQYLLEKLLEMNFSRKDMILALGGGVIGDLSGFVASTYKRGCRFMSIPTTTLSQIDSSIGGKVAINLHSVKNCVGNFYHPELVIVDTTTLSTLPKRHFYNGLVEAFKGGCIQDPVLYQLFKEHAHELNWDSDILEEIIIRSLLMKKKVVEEDEKETSLRKILNFGHTIGHAIESSYHLHDYYHGECVANGMIRVQENEKLKKEFMDIFQRMGIPLIQHLDVEECINFIKNDKKAKGNEIELVKVDTVGEAYLEKIQIDELRKYIEEDLL